MSTLSVTNTFLANTTAVASQVNANFTDIVSYINSRNTGSVKWEGFATSGNAAIDGTLLTTGISTFYGGSAYPIFFTDGKLAIGNTWNGNDSPLNIWKDGATGRFGMQISHKNTNSSRVPVAIFQNFDALAQSVGNCLAFYGRNGVVDVQHGILAFSNVGATAVNAQFELFLNSNSESLPVINSVGSGVKGYAYTMFGPTGADFAGSYPYGAYTPGSTIHVASDTGDVDSGVRIERRATTTGRFNLFIKSDGNLCIGEVDVSTKRIVLSKTTGYISIPGVYDQTSGSAANVVVDSSGNLMRSTSSLKYKKEIVEVGDDEANKLLDATPITYKSLGKSDDQSVRHYGLIAEELALIDDKLITYRTNVDGELVPDSVQYERVVVPLLRVIQSMSKKLSTLEDKIKKLEITHS